MVVVFSLGSSGESLDVSRGDTVVVVGVGVDLTPVVGVDLTLGAGVAFTPKKSRLFLIFTPL